MKLNKPLITICLIIILVINLIFFSFLSVGKKTEDKEYIKQIVSTFDFKEYLLNNSTIDKSINEYKYPKEVFDYLDSIKIDELKDEIVDNLFNKSDYLINKEDIIDILNNSVYEFEASRTKDIYSYVKDDIEEYSMYFDNKLNKDIKDGYFYVNRITNALYPVSILISIIIFGIIIIFEKENGILLSSIVLLSYSFFVFYVDKYFISFSYKRLLKYFKFVNLELDNLYIICFILGFVLLLIYIIKSLRRFARNVRISSYNRM